MEETIYVQDLYRTFKVPVFDNEDSSNLFQRLLMRQYRDIAALNGISFKVKEGEFVGYLGPNGSGKSTTMKCLTGVIVPDSGTVEVCGHIPWKNRVKYTQNIGVVFGQKSLLNFDLPVKDSFLFYQAVYKIPDASFHSNVDDLAVRFDISNYLSTPVRKLSLGQRMKCELVAALLHKPRILFLDEPTIGMDFTARKEFRKLLQETQSERNLTVMLTSHELSEVEMLCDRVIVIENGNKSFDGRIERLREKVSSGQIVDITYSHIIDEGEYKMISKSHQLISQSENKLCFFVNLGDCVNFLSRITKAIEVSDITVKDEPLEDVLAKWYTLN